MKKIRQKREWEQVPSQLKELPNWVCWDKSKRPIDPKNGRAARANDSTTWGTYKQAVDHYRRHKDQNVRGIGFEFGDSGYAGIDLDDCRDRTTGDIEPWASKIIEELKSYTEISASGKGIHVIVKGKLPEGKRRNGNVEMYDQGRYFIVTGKHLEGTPVEIKGRGRTLKEVHRKFMGSESPPSTVTVKEVDQDVAKIVDEAMSGQNGEDFARLWKGEWEGRYQSQSEADLALCSHLAIWAGNNPALIDRAFRKSGLYRDKWDKDHYREATIAKVLPRNHESPIVPVTTPIIETTKAEQFPDIMDGLAGEFAQLYSSCLEAPKHFFYMAFLTCFGIYLGTRFHLDTEVSQEPRLYTLLLGESANDRKSTAITKTIDFFKLVQKNFAISYGVNSAEGLAERLRENPSLLLIFDEFKTFVSKTKIESSVLLPCVNTLFESNRYESRTKNAGLRIENAHLSIIGASTIQTHERTWDSRFTDIGFTNRLFIVPGSATQKFAFPDKIPTVKKEALAERVRHAAESTTGRELSISKEAYAFYNEWYQTREQSIHAKRLDTYAIRFMGLLAMNEEKRRITRAIVEKVIKLMDWQLEARKLYDPIDADNKMAIVEEKIRRQLKKSPKTKRELKRAIHYERVGAWFFEQAIKNLERAEEIVFDGNAARYALKL